MQPPDDAQQRRHSFRLDITPAAATHQQLDFYGNTVHFIEISNPHSDLVIEACSLVETSDACKLSMSDASVGLFRLQDPEVSWKCFDFLQPSQFAGFDESVTIMARNCAAGYSDVWQSACALMSQVHGLLRYQSAVTPVHTTMFEALRLGQGVCQDFAHVMIGLCRSIGLPARYVSGYIYNGPTDQLKGAQATHAWVEVWVPDFGWLGLDPTNNHPADGRYVKAATGRDYSDVAPLKGTYRGTANRTLQVEVLVSLAV